ncbi:hypothetical protein KUTeg_006779 [Tegillarca granosa]|uniref:Uncharacterized protein n=1 Tax=Tegillarca granosa TaxID=220873 RepID=A0ABQ9FBB8_TEGGR|nr:hypothetical protein KUTeg_006779 [Tegillarca granosa]
MMAESNTCLPGKMRLQMKLTPTKIPFTSSSEASSTPSHWNMSGPPGSIQDDYNNAMQQRKLEKEV